MLITIILTMNCLAQTTENDLGKISINVVLPENKEIPAEASKLLETKLRQIVTRYGIADNGLSERFVITAKTNVIQKDIAPSNPPRISQKLEITFMIGDVMENKVYETASLEISGMGTNETKAYVSAFQNISPANKIFAEMIEKAKEKIVTYYTERCEQIIKEAQTLSVKNEYGQAIYKLSQIPNLSKDCYSKALTQQEKIYTQMIETEGMKLFTQAKNLWATSPNREGASEAMSFIEEINPQVSFFGEVQKFVNQVTAKVELQGKKEWEQRVKEYNDQLKTEQMRIKAYKDVAMEYAKNQPKEINNTKIVTLW